MIDNATFEDRIAALADRIEEADAVLIGAGAGLSTAAGYTYAGERFERLFADFIDAYGFADMYSAGFYPFHTPEERWAFWSRYVWCNRYQDPPKDTYAQLLRLVRDKDHFVITTNVDHCFQKAGFAKDRLFYTQGDYGLFQCSTPCHNKTYDNEDAIRAMVEQQRDMRVPSSLVPRCPVCGEPMSMNLRADDTFVEDAGWHAAYERYVAWLEGHVGGRIVYLECGVGANTPVIIKYPFWRLTAANAQATYACLNLGQAVAPEEIEGRSILVDADLDEAIRALVEARGERSQG